MIFTIVKVWQLIKEVIVLRIYFQNIDAESYYIRVCKIVSILVLSIYFQSADNRMNLMWHVLNNILQHVVKCVFFYCLAVVWRIENPGLAGYFTCRGHIAMTRYKQIAQKWYTFCCFDEQPPRLKANSRMKLIENKVCCTLDSRRFCNTCSYLA